MAHHGTIKLTVTKPYLMEHGPTDPQMVPVEYMMSKVFFQKLPIKMNAGHSSVNYAGNVQIVVGFGIAVGNG